jgi:cell division protein FtsI/penicillin-binding protein 2
MTEQLAKQYTQEFLADSIAITIMDPRNGEIKSLTNYPTFNPNSPNKEYELIPLEYDHKEILDNITYLDHPIFIQTGDQLKLATSAERTNPIYRKYINKNKI